MGAKIAGGDGVVVDLDAYADSAPSVGDVVAFHGPAGIDNKGGFQCGAVGYPPSEPCPKANKGFASEDFIKRIVAGPGDEVSLRDGLPVVNGKTTFSDVIQSCSGPSCDLPKPITVPPGHYFLMGDNSRASHDSRYWGPLSQASIFGKAELH